MLSIMTQRYSEQQWMPGFCQHCTRTVCWPGDAYFLENASFAEWLPCWEIALCVCHAPPDVELQQQTKRLRIGLPAPCCEQTAPAPTPHPTLALLNE